MHSIATTRGWYFLPNSAKGESTARSNEPEEADRSVRDILVSRSGAQLASSTSRATQTSSGGSGRSSHREANSFPDIGEPYERLYYTGRLQVKGGQAQMLAGRSQHSRRHSSEACGGF